MYKRRRYYGGRNARSFKRGTYKRAAFIGPMNLIGPRRKPLNWRTGGFLGIENKFRDVEVLDDPFATAWAPMEPTGSVLALSVVAQGDDQSQRDGRVYHIGSIHIQGRIHRAAAESDTAPQDDIVARIVVVWDTQTNGAQLTATNVMDATQTDDFDAWRNLQFSKRFKILFDKKIVLTGRNQSNEGAVNLFASGEASTLFKFNKTFATPIKVICSATTAAVASVTDNTIHMIGVASSTQALLSYQCRTRFTG